MIVICRTGSHHDSELSPGVYLCQLRSGTETKMLKVMVLR